MPDADYEKAIASISRMKWLDIAPRLFAFSKSRGTSDPEDFANEAIKQTISGERRWDYGSVKLEAHLINTVKSLIYNDFRKQRVRDETAEEIRARTEHRNEVQKQTQDRVLEMQSEYRFLVKHDEKLAAFYLKLLEAIFDRGCKTQAEIAAFMRLKPATFHDRKKELESALTRDDATRVTKGRRSDV